MVARSGSRRVAKCPSSEPRATVAACQPHAIPRQRIGAYGRGRVGSAPHGERSKSLRQSSR